MGTDASQPSCAGWTVNGKRVRRIMREMVLCGKTYRRTTNSNHPFPRFANLVCDREVVSPDEVWVSDITYVRLRSEFVYLAVIMAVFTRCVRGWHLGRGLDQELTLAALKLWNTRWRRYTTRTRESSTLPPPT